MKYKLGNIFYGCFFILAILLAGCKGPKEDPADTAKAFYEALADKDFDKASKFATRDSKTMLELIKSMSELGAEINAGNDELEKIRTAVYITDQIEGEKATVKVRIGEVENIVTLKKEDGAWKVAMDKESLKETIGENTGESSEETKNRADSIGQALEEEVEVIRSDSVK